MFLLKSNFESFGLDIGDHTLKAALVKKAGSGWALSSYNKLDLPAGMLERGVIKDSGALIKVIKKLLATGVGRKINTPYVHACLPEVQTFIKLVNIAADKENLMEAIKTELPNHIPLDPAESYIDWRVVNADDKNKATRVLVGAVPKAIADSYNKILLDAGLKPVSLQIEAEAILRSLLPLQSLPQEALAVVDIGATRSSFIGLEKQTIQFSFSLPFSGNKVTAQIKQNLNLSQEEAERAKIVCGLDPAKCKGIMLEVVQGALTELRDAIKKNLDFYGEHFHGSAIKTIRLCGGGANLAGLTQYLAAGIPGVKFIKGDPFANLTLKNKKGAAYRLHGSDDYLTYTTALGLALSNI